jgi:flagellar motor switch protein FliN
MSDSLLTDQPPGDASREPSAPAMESFDGPASAPAAPVMDNFDASPPPAPALPADSVDLLRLSDVPMELSVEVGRTRMTVGETLQLCAGSIVTLERLAGEPVDLLVNGTPIARGEVVIVNEQFGLRVTEVIEGGPAAVAAEELPAAAGPATTE